MRRREERNEKKGGEEERTGEERREKKCNEMTGMTAEAGRGHLEMNPRTSICLCLSHLTASCSVPCSAALHVPHQHTHHTLFLILRTENPSLLVSLS
jgi:hypothetical protein